MLGGNAFGMELNAVDGQVAMAEAHDRPVVAGGVDEQAVGNILHDERVIARRGKGRRDTNEKPGAVMGDRRCLAVHQTAAHHAPAEILSDGLMAQTHAQQRLACIGAGTHDVEADPGFIGGAGTGREQERFCAGGHGLSGRHGIIADDFHFGAQFHEIVDEVPGEAVVVVDDKDHDRTTARNQRSVQSPPLRALRQEVPHSWLRIRAVHIRARCLRRCLPLPERASRRL